MHQKEQSRWRPTKRQLLWTGGIVAVLAVAVLIGYRYGITLWDWIKLLIVPAVIAGGGFWFNAQQREREQRIAAERAQDDALQAYIDGMAELLTDKDQPLHSAQLGDSLRTVARARTLTVLGRLDSGRKRSVLQFLYESGLIGREQALLHESDLIERQHNIVVLGGADLSGANLYRANLSDADLHGANLSGANLYGANLHGADLSGASLMKANLFGAYLSRADLHGAYLSGGYLFGADLSGADLSGADLSEANLIDADLSEANLEGATGITGEQLTEARILKGATMPNGQKYEDWLKSKDQEQNK